MLDKVLNASTCTSSFYCPPSTLVPTTRELVGHSYSFLQVRRKREDTLKDQGMEGKGRRGGKGG